MSYLSAHRFCTLYGGLDSLLEFVRSCNKKPLVDVAASFKMSLSAASRWRQTLLVCRWEANVGCEEFIRQQLNGSREELREKQEKLEQLQLRPSTLKLLEDEASS